MVKCGILACANPSPNIELVFRIMQILGSVKVNPGLFPLDESFSTMPILYPEPIGGRYKCSGIEKLIELSGNSMVSLFQSD